MIDKKILEMCLHVWESPLTSNACVILRGSSESPELVHVSDLDLGECYDVPLTRLKVKMRESEPTDYSFSWSMDGMPADEVVDAVYDAHDLR